MRKLTVLVGLAAFLLGAIAMLAPLPLRADAPTGLTVVKSSERGLTIEWRLPPLSQTPVRRDGAWVTTIAIDGLPLSTGPGRPQLPVAAGLIGLPPGGSATLTITAIQTETIDLPAPPAAAPAPIPKPTDPTRMWAATLDQTVFGRNAFFPAQVAALQPAGQFRQNRLARLTIHPVRVNPVTGRAQVVRFLQAEITFDQPAPAGRTPASAAENPIALDTLAQSLLNPQAVNWAADRPSPTLLRLPQAGGTLKISVDAPGWYIITYADLQAAGWPVDTLDAHTLQLSYGPNRLPVRIIVRGENDNRFNPGDAILFYAHLPFSRMVDTDAYFLTHDFEIGKRVINRLAAPAGLPPASLRQTALAEESHFYDSLYPDHRGDRWYWSRLSVLDAPQTTFNIAPQTPPAPAIDPPELTVWLRGYTSDADHSPDHRVRVAVNGIPVADQTWDGPSAYTLTVPLTGTALLTTGNVISVSLPGLADVPVEGAWLDAAALTWPVGTAQNGQMFLRGASGQNAYTVTGWLSQTLSLFDVSDPLNPIALNSFVYDGQTLAFGDIATGPPADYLIVPEDALRPPAAIEPVTFLTDPPAGADAILIAPSEMMTAVTPLANWRVGQGLRVVTASVQSIYDTFGGGRPSAEAIRRFLQRAYTAWPAPAPLTVLLVGDGSYDFKNYSGWKPTTVIPPYLADVDPWLGETAADNRFVTLAGDDPLPDMLIGRLAVNTPTEAETVVQKIIGYEADPALGPWNANLLLVSEYGPGENWAADFHAASDIAFAGIVDPFVGKRYYYSDIITGTPHVYTDSAALRTDFLSALNRGAGFVTFNGHSSWHQWGFNQLLRWNRDDALNDVTHLRNGARLPVVVEMTCFTGYFQHPEYPTLDESLLRQAGGGAVAVWGATGQGVATGHADLQAGFYDAVWGQSTVTLGAAALAGKQRLFATGLNLDLLDTFTLFGDPAMTLNLTIRPFPYHTYLPVTLKNATGGGTGTFGSGSFAP